MQIHSITDIDVKDRCYLCNDEPAEVMVKMIEPSNGLRLNMPMCRTCQKITQLDPDVVMLQLEDE
jgi:hypothetical protein